MPSIVNFKTKKDFKQALNNNELILMENPSMFAPFTGILQEYMKDNKLETFTNHPKRSWFAQVKNVNGVLKVSQVLLKSPRVYLEMTLGDSIEYLITNQRANKMKTRLDLGDIIVTVLGMFIAGVYLILSI